MLVTVPGSRLYVDVANQAALLWTISMELICCFLYGSHTADEYSRCQVGFFLDILRAFANVSSRKTKDFVCL